MQVLFKEDMMARPLRIEYAGGVYHLTSRGNCKSDIYLSDNDKINFLAILDKVCRRYAWICHAYCLMSNHYHLLVETPFANLTKGMHYLNSVYTQRFNKTHERVGHVFQGRYKSIVVEKQSYLLELARYIVLNPVRAGLVLKPEDWYWSSYLATCEETPIPSLLKVSWLLSLFDENKHRAIDKYKRFVREGFQMSSPWLNLKNQIYLGSEKFVNEALKKIVPEKDLTDIPKPQYRKMPIFTLEEYSNLSSNRNEAIKLAYESGVFSMKQIGNHYGLHYSSISKIVKSKSN